MPSRSAFVAALATSLFAAATLAEEARVLKVVVLDEQGRPLEGAGVQVSIWEMPGEPDFPNADYTTDSQGVAAVKIPHRLQILRIWPSKAGYVPEFLNFAQGTHEEGGRVPDRYEFRLTRGAKLSGVVVDEAGRPVPGARVAVRVEVDEPTWGSDPEPIISTWLKYSGVETDDRGCWEIDNAPPPKADGDYEFRLKVSHDDFISDADWGGLQEEQGITTEDLREGVARFVLGRGVRVGGAVVDQEGEPIREGLVVWHDDPYHHAGADETRLDEAGRFRSVPLPKGERTFTVVAPGFEPQTRKLELKAEMDEVLFELNPGKRLALRLVAAGGEPVPDATVSIARWRGANALYNHRHPNVPDSEVPRKTDKQGLFLWSWAPADAVTYRIWAKGYASQQVTLVATEAEHTVTLAAKLEASGKVTKPDAQAGSIE